MKYIVAIAIITFFAVIVLMADSLGLMALLWAALGGIILGGFGFVVVIILFMFHKAAVPDRQLNLRSPSSHRIQAQPELKKRPGWLQLLHLLDHMRK
jgi:hypothetical protein